jgi:hypothetical protein
MRVLTQLIFLIILSIISTEIIFAQNFTRKDNLTWNPRIVNTELAGKYFTKCETIKLSTTDSTLIGKIDKLILFEGSFYLLDKVQRSILRFSRTGQFIGKYQKIGRGPDEYNKITDFDIDVKGRKLVVLTDLSDVFFLDPELRKIGTKVETSRVSQNIFSLYDNKVALYTYSGVYLTDQGKRIFAPLTFLDLGSKKQEYMFTDDIATRISFTSQSSFFVSGRKIITLPLRFSLFMTDDGIDFTELMLNFGDRNMKDTEISGIKCMRDIEGIFNPLAENVVYVTNPLISGNIFYIETVIGVKSYNAFYNFKTKRGDIVKEIRNDLSEFPFGKPIGGTSDFLITVVENAEIIKSGIKPTGTDARFNEMDNPFINLFYVR